MKKQLTFVTAILSILKEFTEHGKSFSAYEVTQEFRRRVNDGEYELSDKTPVDITGIMTYEIIHNDVNDFVKDIWYADLMKGYRREVLATTNYWTYICGAPSIPIPDSTPQPTSQFNPVADALARGTVSSPTIIPSPSAVIKFKVSAGFDEDGVAKYVERRQAKGIPATLRSIANRFKRDGATIGDVECIVVNNPDFGIGWQTPRNQSVVTLI